MSVNWGIRLLLLLLLSLLTSAFSLLPNGEYDITPRGHNKQIVESQISKILKTTHLQISTKETFQPKIKGVIYQTHWMVNLTTFLEGCKIKRDIVFLIATGSPQTILSKETFLMMYEDCGWNYTYPQQRKVYIHSRSVTAHIDGEYFQGVNILGGNYFRKHSHKLVGYFWESLNTQSVGGQFQIEFNAENSSFNEEEEKKRLSYEL